MEYTNGGVLNMALDYVFIAGFNIFASGMFTTLTNGIVSAVLAFSRSFVFMLITKVLEKTRKLSVNPSAQKRGLQPKIQTKTPQIPPKQLMPVTGTKEPGNLVEE